VRQCASCYGVHFLHELLTPLQAFSFDHCPNQNVHSNRRSILQGGYYICSTASNIRSLLRAVTTPTTLRCFRAQSPVVIATCGASSASNSGSLVSPHCDAPALASPNQRSQSNHPTHALPGPVATASPVIQAWYSQEWSTCLLFTCPAPVISELAPYP
jgi:hypothetical protein